MILNRLHRVLLLGPPVIMIMAGSLWAFMLDKRLFDDPLSFVVEDKNGVLLGASIAEDGQWRFPELDKVPDKLGIAVTAFEDRRFYYHLGLDPLALARAVVSNFKAGYIVSGASTITMQLVRLQRKGKPRIISEKILEAITALRLELRFSKEEILALYVSNAPYGGNTVGIEAAAWRYFSRSPQDLSWAEAAMLAVLPNSPSAVNLQRLRESLKIKRDKLLLYLYEQGHMDEYAYTAAIEEALPDEPKVLPQLAPHVLQHFYIEYKQNPEVHRIRTSLDVSVQQKLNRIMERYRKLFASHSVLNAASCIIDVKSGETLAYFGNYFYPEYDEISSYVDICQSPRSTASVLKPILYAAMMDGGDLLPDQLIPDIPTRMGAYMPENHTKIFSGAVSARDAVVHSLNVPLARMLKNYGIDRFYDLLKILGFKHLFRPASQYGITLILGGAESTLWELTGVYASLARSVLPDAPEKALFEPTLLYGHDPHDRNERLMPISPGAVWLAMDAIQDVERPDEEGSWQFFQSSKKIAWKTGTSFGYKDAWAVGTTDRYAVGVWVGNADGNGVPFLKGSSAAGPVLFDVFSVLEDGSWFERPLEMDYIEVCAKSGFAAGPSCEEKKWIPIPKNAFPKEVCPYCRIVHTDKDLRRQVDSSIYPASEIVSTKWFVLPPVMEWYYKQNNIDYKILPPFHEKLRSFQENSRHTSIGLVYPNNNARIYLPVEFGGEAQPLILEAHHSIQEAVLYWYMDGVFMGMSEGLHQLELYPEPGKHQLTIMDSYGALDTRNFEILSH